MMAKVFLFPQWCSTLPLPDVSHLFKEETIFSHTTFDYPPVTRMHLASELVLLLLQKRKYSLVALCCQDQQRPHLLA